MNCVVEESEKEEVMTIPCDERERREGKRREEKGREGRERAAVVCTTCERSRAR